MLIRDATLFGAGFLCLKLGWDGIEYGHGSVCSLSGEREAVLGYSCRADVMSSILTSPGEVVE